MALWHGKNMFLGLLIDLTDNSNTSYRREWIALTNKVSTASFEINRNGL